MATVYERVKAPWWSNAAADFEMEDEVTEHPEIEQECPSASESKAIGSFRQMMIKNE